MSPSPIRLNRQNIDSHRIAWKHIYHQDTCQAYLQVKYFGNTHISLATVVLGSFGGRAPNLYTQTCINMYIYIDNCANCM